MSRKRYEQLEILQDPDRKPKRKRKLGPIYIPWRWVAGSFIVGAALVMVVLVALFGIRLAPPPVIPDVLSTSAAVPLVETSIIATPLPIPTLTGGSEFLRSLSWVNGRLAAAGSDTLRVYDDTISPGAAHWMLDYGQSVNRAFNSIALSPDGSQVAGIVTVGDPDGAGRSSVSVWDARNGSLLRSLDTHIGGNAGYGPGGLDEIIYTPDSTRMITSAGDGQAIVWDATTGEKLGALETGGIATLAMAFLPNSSHLVLVSSTDRPTADLQIWDIDTLQMIDQTIISGPALYQVVLSPNADYAAVQEWTEADNWFVAIWDIQRGERLGAVPIRENIETIYHLAIDKNLLALSGFVGQHVDETTGKTIDTHTEVRALRWNVDESGTFQYERIGAKEDFVTQAEIRELHFTTDSGGTWLNYITGASGSSLQRWNLDSGAVEALPFW